MGSDLKHTICGSIYDQFAGAHMLVPVIRNDLCAGVRLIAQHISAGADPELFQHILGEAVRIGRQWLGRIAAVGWSVFSPTSTPSILNKPMFFICSI